MAYLKDKLGYQTIGEVKEHLLIKCSKFNFKQLSEDIKPFIFDSSDSKKVLYFIDYINSL